MKDLLYFIAVFAWLAGIVLADGALAFAATVFPPYGWYLVVKHIMFAMGVV